MSEIAKMFDLSADEIQKLTEALDSRSQRILAAIGTPVRERTAKQAALCALGNLIDRGVFR